jgi:hypothetical protein
MYNATLQELLEESKRLCDATRALTRQSKELIEQSQITLQTLADLKADLKGKRLKPRPRK